MRFITLPLSFFLTISTSFFAFAGTTDPNTPDSKYVEFGKQFPCVVRIRSKVACNNPECDAKEHTQFGSAVIIKPNWVLTAAHVVNATTDQTVIKDSGVEYPVQQIIVHKDFKDDNVGFHDIALCYSPKDFELKFYTPLYRKNEELGKPITISGFGIHGTFSTGITTSDGIRRAGQNVIDNIERGVLVCRPTAGRGRMPLEFGIASGDSGGGMFIGNELAGINSFIMSADSKPDGTYGDESAFTRVSLYFDWVHEQIQTYELALQARSTTGKDIALHDKEVQQ